MKQNWWLYGTDLELARIKQIELIDSTRDPKALEYQISILTYLGDYSGCYRLLKKHELLKSPLGRHAQFKINSSREIIPAWQKLLNPPENKILGELSRKFYSSKSRIIIELVGGIGDQVQNASLCLGLSHSGLFKGRLLIESCGEHSRIVNSYLQSSEAKSILFRKGDSAIARMSTKFIRSWLEIAQEPVEYKSLFIDSTDQNTVSPKNTLLACWRTKADMLHPVSSFSRSIKFADILNFYQRWDQESKGIKTTFIDMTDYTKEERMVIKNLFSWVNLIRSEIKTLHDTNDWINNCETIISVDTSLAHISAIRGKKVHLLLPLFPDERWIELLKYNTIYSKNVLTFKQSNFHDWSQPLELLRFNLINRYQTKDRSKV